jgi:hypothetical protein
MLLTFANRYAMEFACKHYHYTGKVPGGKVIGYNVYNDKREWCGIIIYGSGVNLHIAEPYNKWQGQVIELVRIALNGKQSSVSEPLSISLKLIKKDIPLLDLIVSYADANQDHYGGIYQATNWIYEGEFAREQGIRIYGKIIHKRTVNSRYGTSSIDWLKENIDPNAEIVKGKSKFKYLYPLNKKMREKVKLLAKPYPKEKDI